MARASASLCGVEVPGKIDCYLNGLRIATSTTADVGSAKEAPVTHGTKRALLPQRMMKLRALE